LLYTYRESSAAKLERGHRLVENSKDDDDRWLTNDSEDEGDEIEVQMLAEAIETMMVLVTDKEE
jgi:hypothetical protein